jgi:hypothetical protein
VCGKVSAEPLVEATFVKKPLDVQSVNATDTLNEERLAEGPTGEVGQDVQVGLGGENQTDVRGCDPSIFYLGAIRFFGEKRLSAVNGSCFCYGSFEGDVLKGVESVVVDKNSDGPLGWEEMCGVMYCLVQTTDSLILAVRRGFMGWLHRP